MNINDAFPSNYLKASDLKGKAVVVTIRSVELEEVGRTKERKPVLYFQGKEKGIVLNRTNSKKIAELAGSQDTDDWHGVEVAIYPTETEFGGETVECIRIKAPKAAQRKAAPPPEPEPVVGGPVFDDDVPFARMPSY